MDRAQNTLLLLNSSPSIWRAMEEFHFRLARALVDKGARVVIVLANEVPLEIRSKFESSGAKIYFVAYRNRWRFFREIRRIVRNYEITTVHMRFFRLNHFIAWLICFNRIETIIYTDAEGGVSQAAGVKHWLKACRTRITTAPMTRLIAISDFVKTRLVRSGVAREKITTIHNGIDLQRFRPDPSRRAALIRKYNLAPDAHILITVSRLWDIKRVDLLLEACARIAKRGLPFRFLIAGDGPEREQLKRLAGELNLDEYVTWLGATDCPEQLMQGSNVFVLGTNGEAFGNVIVEAMACGLPVVASRSGGPTEIVVDGSCGLLAEPDNPDSFAECIENLIRHREKRERLSAAAIERAKLFSVEEAVRKTLEVYEALWQQKSCCEWH